ncbi:uncharacterized protein LAESUDRAFT_758132 [Laetiporus sulphureus 93-53]|uniref:Uncharacterized protein n=1 Tax=Laetiporus sulphureus 93-53 TaxID=1314785 RepID=A0A165EZ12_9APHY|nr:uncharacterized protein LAESUDRAFT_758132 [Laetiporus sulphureus 93-53]KZT08014.1 hypothetical protein LAESUDRAFT_758132 [Laetiporus sulphureus 93-53]
MPAPKHPIPEDAAEMASPAKRTTRASNQSVEDKSSHATDTPVSNLPTTGTTSNAISKQPVRGHTTTQTSTEAIERIDAVHPPNPILTSAAVDSTLNDNNVDDTQSSSVSTTDDESETDTSVISIAGFTYTQKFAKRISNLGDYVSIAHNIYGIRKLPASSTWGAGMNEPTLCINNEPVVVYIVGEIVNSSFLFTREPKKQATMTVNPLRSIDLHAANSLIRRISEWREDDSPPPTTITTGVRQSRKGKREGDWTTSLFKNVWDAKRTLPPKEDDY